MNVQHLKHGHRFPHLVFAKTSDILLRKTHVAVLDTLLRTTERYTLAFPIAYMTMGSSRERLAIYTCFPFSNSFEERTRWLSSQHIVSKWLEGTQDRGVQSRKGMLKLNLFQIEAVQNTT